MTAYGFRRGAATRMARDIGQELTKAMLHHKQNSNTLYEHYSLNATQVDLTASALYGEHVHASHLTRIDAPALLR